MIAHFGSNSRKAFALIYFLLISAIVLIVTGTIVMMCRRQLFFSRVGLDQNRALYAAESGVSTAIAQLERNNSWTAGFLATSTPDNQATYTVRFNSSESINNLAGASAVASYRGPNTVPAHGALLVVEGQAGVAKQVVEVLVVPGVSPLQSSAISATGQVKLGGDVAVDGVRSLNDLTSVPADIHSNREITGLQISSSGTLNVSGNVTSSSQSPAATAIQLSGTVTVGSQVSQVPAKRFPHVNIDALVSDQVGNPGPAVPVAPGAFSLNGGNNYYSGDVVIQGDLELKSNAKMFVAGNLTVNGSVKGTGTLVVKGQTSLYGDADVSVSSSEYISVLSKGHVVLQGFQGQSYMNGLTGAAANQWADLQFGLGKISDYLRSNAGLAPAAMMTQMQADDGLLDSYQRIIGTGSGSWASLTPAYNTVANRASSAGTALALKAAVGVGGPTSAPTFLANRFQRLDDIFRICWEARGGAAGRYTADTLMGNYALWDPAVDGGLFDSIQSFGTVGTAARVQTLHDVQQMIGQYDFNRLGAANFKGLVYTSGAFVAHSDVVVMGAVIVNGDASVGPLTVGPNTYQPGDFVTTDTSHFTYVDDIFKNGVQNLGGGGALDIKRWVNR